MTDKRNNIFRLRPLCIFYERGGGSPPQKVKTRDGRLGLFFGRTASSPLSRVFQPFPGCRFFTNNSSGSTKQEFKKRSLEFDSKSFSQLIDLEISKFNGMFSLMRERQLIGFLKERIAWVGGKMSRSKCALICVFVKLCFRLYSNEGMKGLVLYLKTSYVLIQQSIAGYKIDDQGPLKRRVRRARSGLPNGIPTVQRTLLINKDIPTIRFWTSLCSIYRILNFPSKVNIDSIVEPGKENWSPDGADLSFFKEAVNIFGYRAKIERLRESVKNGSFDLFPIGKSSPLTKYHWDFTSSLQQLLGGRRKKKGGSGFISTSENLIKASAHLLFNVHKDILDYMMVFGSNSQGFMEFFSKLKRASITTIHPSLFRKKFLIGALGLKDEPAGKVRVFAMVDCGTQWLLKPLHLLLQDVVRPIKEDATFDQLGVVEAKLKMLKKKYRIQKAMSYDLSSATDRLPIGIQVSILQPLLGEYEAKAGAALLTFRDYSLPARAVHDCGRSSVKYAVGQPMGALSSGMMLAITHHICVQGAALRAGKLGYKRGFDEYVILGDDIVIFDSDVSVQYYLIMTWVLGVKIGLAKSIKSKSSLTLEFAKKYGVDGERAFIVPCRDIIVACLSTDTLVEFTTKYAQPFQSYLRMRGLGYKTRSKGMNNLGSMPTRLRIYIVYKGFYQMNFMEGVTLKSLRVNYIITRKGIETFIEELYKMRDEKIKNLESRRTITLEEIGLSQTKPLFQGTKLHDYLTDTVEGGKFINSCRFWPKIDLRYLSAAQLRELLHEILEQLDLLDNKGNELPTLTLITQVRVEPKPYNDINTVYNRWVRLNKCFSENQKGVGPDIFLSNEPGLADSAEESDLLRDGFDEAVRKGGYSVTMEKHIWSDDVEKSTSPPVSSQKGLEPDLAYNFFDFGHPFHQSPTFIIMYFTTRGLYYKKSGLLGDRVLSIMVMTLGIIYLFLEDHSGPDLDRGLLLETEGSETRPGVYLLIAAFFCVFGGYLLVTRVTHDVGTSTDPWMTTAAHFADRDPQYWCFNSISGRTCVGVVDRGVETGETVYFTNYPPSVDIVGTTVLSMLM